MNLVRFSLAAFLMMVMSVGVAQSLYTSSAERSIRYGVPAVDGSGVDGSVFIADYGFGSAVVVIALSGTPAGASHPSHFHAGDCGSGGDIVVPLNPVNGDLGFSLTVTEAPYDAIVNSDHYLNIQLSPEAIDIIVACGEVGAGASEMMGVMMETEMETQAGFEPVDADTVSPEEFETLQTAFYQIYPTESFNVDGVVQVTEDPDGGARVTVTLRDTDSGQMYPSHFHAGDCGSGGAIVYPLELIPGGPDTVVSRIDASVFDVINSDLHINIHQSPDNLGTIVACGEVGLGANEQWR